MRSQIVCVAVSLILGASVARSQSPVQSAFVACPTPARVYSAIQVQTPAKLLSDSSVSSRPATNPAQAHVVEFVVDTLGVPDVRTLSAKRGVDSLTVQHAAQAISKWRYSPAVASGCKVPQRVSASVIW